MGQAVPILGAIGRMDPCGTWAKYVCNSGRCHSKCGTCVDVEFETHEIDLVSDDSDMELEVDGCCMLRM